MCQKRRICHKTVIFFYPVKTGHKIYPRSCRLLPFLTKLLIPFPETVPGNSETIHPFQYVMLIFRSHTTMIVQSLFHSFFHDKTYIFTQFTMLSCIRQINPRLRIADHDRTVCSGTGSQSMGISARCQKFLYGSRLCFCTGHQRIYQCPRCQISINMK